MTSHMMDLTKLGQFHIITHFKINFSLIIRHLTYPTVSVNLLNQLFESIYAINLLIELITSQAYIASSDKCTYIEGLTFTY